jgi:hypothetical protein
MNEINLAPFIINGNRIPNINTSKAALKADSKIFERDAPGASR